MMPLGRELVEQRLLHVQTHSEHGAYKSTARKLARESSLIRHYPWPRGSGKTAFLGQIVLVGTHPCVRPLPKNSALLNQEAQGPRQPTGGKTLHTNFLAALSFNDHKVVAI